MTDPVPQQPMTPRPPPSGNSPVAGLVIVAGVILGVAGLLGLPAAFDSDNFEGNQRFLVAAGPFTVMGLGVAAVALGLVLIELHRRR